MIRAENLSRSFAARRVVDGLNFNLPAGSVSAFLGPNGAGKTTTLRMITGALAPSSGKVFVAGFDTFEQPYQARAQLGFLPEKPPLYPELRVIEQLRFVARLKGLPLDSIDSVIERCDLSDVLQQLQGQLSKGFRQRTGLACALLGSPSLLILDEPTSGLDPAQIESMRSLIRGLGDDHTVLLSTHLLSEVQAVCDHILMIHEGRLVADDSREALQAEYGGSLQAAFLSRCQVEQGS
jgi:ABC-2 type transport system ATP-binding protein